jgi:hypothetical protein
MWVLQTLRSTVIVLILIIGVGDEHIHELEGVPQRAVMNTWCQ